MDGGKLEALRTANSQRLEGLEATIKDAEENLGDVEVRDARVAKANYLSKIGEPDLCCTSTPKNILHKHRQERGHPGGNGSGVRARGRTALILNFLSPMRRPARTFVLGAKLLPVQGPDK